MRNLSAILAMSALLAPGSGYAIRELTPKPEPEEKPCLNCGKPKRHNNSFCSAECCREHRRKSRNR